MGRSDMGGRAREEAEQDVWGAPPPISNSWNRPGTFSVGLPCKCNSSMAQQFELKIHTVSIMQQTSLCLSKQ